MNELRMKLYLIWHMKVDALLEEHHSAISMAVKRGYVHEGAAILGPFEYRSPKLIR